MISSKVKFIEHCVKNVLSALDVVQNIFSFIGLFFEFPDHLISGGTFLSIKIMVLLSAQVYILGMLLLHRMQRERLMSTANEARWFGHDVRSFRPVCTLVPARIGRLPETNFSLCHVIRPSSREGK